MIGRVTQECIGVNMPIIDEDGTPKTNYNRNNFLYMVWSSMWRLKIRNKPIPENDIVEYAERQGD